MPDPAHAAEHGGLVGKHDEWVFGAVGAWRWEALQAHRERILELVQGSHTIDLGGAAAPLGYGSVVVDYHAQLRGLWDTPPNADVIFASHVLEHFVDAENALVTMHDKLRDGGYIIVHVPSWRQENLRAENWEFHEQTYCLEFETNAPAAYTRLDTLLGRWFNLEVCEYVTHHIIAIGEKK